MKTVSRLFMLITLLVLGCDRSPSAAAPGGAAGATEVDKNWEGDIATREVVIGELSLPSGKIVACDGFVVDPSTPAFTITVVPGRYPVVLTVARSRAGDDERIAYATVRFSRVQPARWEMAVAPGQDPATLKAGELFAYGVDSGTGCFMDPAAQAALIKKLDAQQRYFETIIAEMDKNGHTTWNWANMPMDERSGANFVLFSSGFGDGGYASYFGFDTDGKVACLATDFEVLGDSKDPWQNVAGAAK